MNIIKFNSTHNPNLFEGFFDDFLTRDFVVKKQTNYTPAVNIYENEHEFRLEVAVAGFQKEDFKLNLTEKNLKISAKKKSEPEETEEKAIRKEFGFARFERLFSLPKNIDNEQIKANYMDGILRVSLPKQEEEITNQREIDIL